ncbi:hypothetical protein TWF718_005034 [Orbilia javanica]|uniref:Uncharacterized protein n=1 Tax=Orbilia javanica TaxID=47235 RepID=A0AAN8N983_9PEZI
MIRKGYFSIQPIEFDVSSNSSIVRMELHLDNVLPRWDDLGAKISSSYPISGFPRPLYDDIDLSGRDPRRAGVHRSIGSMLKNKSHLYKGRTSSNTVSMVYPEQRQNT